MAIFVHDIMVPESDFLRRAVQLVCLRG